MINSYTVELPSEYEITNKITRVLSKQDVFLELEYTISGLNKYIKIDRNECSAIYPKYQKIVDNFKHEILRRWHNSIPIHIPISKYKNLK